MWWFCKAFLEIDETTDFFLTKKIVVHLQISRLPADFFILKIVHEIKQVIAKNVNKCNICVGLQ